MTSRTVTAVLPAPKQRVFDYLSRVENLPCWATEFAGELKRKDGVWKVVNGLGEFTFEIRADEETGVIDMLAEGALFPTRVVSLGDESCAFVFTMFQQPGQSEEEFEGQHRSLLHEFENIEQEFAS